MHAIFFLIIKNDKNDKYKWIYLNIIIIIILK